MLLARDVLPGKTVLRLRIRIFLDRGEDRGEPEGGHGFAERRPTCASPTPGLAR